MAEKESKALFGTSLCVILGIPLLGMICGWIFRAFGVYYPSVPCLVEYLVEDIVLIAAWFFIALKCRNFVNGAARIMAYIMGALLALLCVQYLIEYFSGEYLIQGKSHSIVTILIDVVATVLTIIFFAGCRVWGGIKAIGIIGRILQGIAATVWPLVTLFEWWGEYDSISVIHYIFYYSYLFMYFTGLTLAVIWTCIPAKRSEQN